jgi:hypothetical protein
MPRAPLPRLEMLEDRTVPTLMGNTLFPADNPWNENIVNAPVAANSATLVASIGATASLHPDFGTAYGGALNGIPFNVVTGSQPKVNIIIDAYPGESDLQPIPIPAGAVIEGDPLPSAQNTSDRHLIVYDSTNNIVYETWNTHKPSEEPDGQWHADSEAVWNLNVNSFRTAGFTSADAAGLPILPGLVRPDEVLDQGVITHALRFTVPRTQNSYVYPASHEAGVANASLPPMGERFRLKASFDISGFSKTDQVILQALKTYGMIVADNGSSWYLTGSPSSRWNDSDLHSLSLVPGSAFEAVDLTPVVSGLSVTSGAPAGGLAVTVSGSNFSGGAGMTKVFFGSTPAASIQILSDTQIIATAPSHVAGSVDVTVQSPYGTSATSAADVFTYVTSNPADQRYVTALYIDLLHRTPDPGGLANWSGLLDRGVPRAQVVQGLENSAERLGIVVDGLYSKLLGRAADPGGRQNFIQFLQNGGTAEQMSLILVTSGEYTSENASDTAFIQSLYGKLLGRIAGQGEVAQWLAILPMIGRAAAANGFLASAEFRADAVEQMYGPIPAPAGTVASLFPNLLRRIAAPSAAEVNGWVRSALDLRIIEELFAGSDEFYANA